MNASIRLRVCVMLFALLLGACQRTMFEHPPSQPEGCDPQLAGRWLSQGDTRDGDGEIEALIDSDCELSIVEHENGTARRSQATHLGYTRDNGMRYVWVDAAWAHRSFEIDAGPLHRDGDVYLFAYSINRDVLRLAAPPHRALAHRVLDKDVAGEVLMRENELTVRVAGDQAAIRDVLRTHRLFRFDESSLRFHRTKDTP